MNRGSGLDNRHRDRDGTIERKKSNTKVETLRREYGSDFGGDIRRDAHLDTLLERTGCDSLSEYLRKFRH
jgi:hypothetical protein